MESAGAQILKQVVDASEIEQVNTGNEWEFRYKNNAIFTVYTVKQEVPFYDVVFVFTIYVLKKSSFWSRFLFKSFQK